MHQNTLVRTSYALMSKVEEEVWLVETFLPKEEAHKCLLVHKQLTYEDTGTREPMAKNRTGLY